MPYNKIIDLGGVGIYNGDWVIRRTCYVYRYYMYIVLSSVPLLSRPRVVTALVCVLCIYNTCAWRRCFPVWQFRQKRNATLIDTDLYIIRKRRQRHTTRIYIHINMFVSLQHTLTPAIVSSPLTFCARQWVRVRRPHCVWLMRYLTLYARTHMHTD